MESPKGLIKVCKNCEKSKDLNNFHRQKKGFLGRNSVCKDCRKKRKIKYVSTKDLVLCNMCNIKKKTEDFYKNSSSKNGLQSYCKTCQKKNISKSGSKIENFCKLVLKKFKRKNKDKIINLKVNDLIRKYNLQKGKCYLTNHLMLHQIDLKQRTDNIWNLSICCNTNLNVINYKDFNLGVHLIYTMKHVYNLNDNKIMEIYQNLANK